MNTQVVLKKLQYVGTKFCEPARKHFLMSSHVLAYVCVFCATCRALAVVPQVHQSVWLELLPTQRALCL